MIIVTGAAGFIGANLVKGLNQAGRDDVLAVDAPGGSTGVENLADCALVGYLDKHTFLNDVRSGNFTTKPDAILHCGACTDTMVDDDDYLHRNNYQYSVALLDYCQRYRIPFIYASSAAVYGANRTCLEAPEYEAPLNSYGAYKLRFDQTVRERMGERCAQIVGLRYFNVYGNREQHKGRMASYVYQMFEQFRNTGTVRLFEGSGGYADGEQCRDFVSVDDVVMVNRYFMDHPQNSGIFNVGSSRARSFNDVARAVINRVRASAGEAPLALAELQKRGAITYVPFPDGLRERYQNFTQADVAALRATGYTAPFTDAENGVTRYISNLLTPAVKCNAALPGIIAVGT